MSATAVRPPQGQASRGHAFTGTWRLTRLALRRDRVVLPVWMLVLVVLLVASVASIVALYDTEAQRTQYAVVAAASAVARAFDGPMSGTSLGAVTMTETFGVLAVIVGIMSLQAVARHTRQEEETGRAELVGAGAVGRDAPLAAGLAVAAGASVAVGAATVGTLLAFGLPAAGSVAAGAALAGVGAVFAAVAAVTAQVSSTQRGANGLAGAAVGAAFLLRAVGDAAGQVAPSGVVVTSAWPSWLSPIGWGQQVRAFGVDGEQWWLLGLFVALALTFTASAFLLRARRDLGAGMVAVRPGPARASARLRSPLGLAFRLQRGVWMGWAAGIVVLAAAFGVIGDEAEEFATTSEEFAAALAALGEGTLTELFFSLFMGMLGVIAAGFTVQAVLRTRAEESGGRAESVLATAVSRPAWLGSHVLWAVVGTGALLGLAGLAAGSSYALVTGGGQYAGSLVVAGLAQAPAALALGGFVVAAVGLLPRRAVALGWAGFVAAFLFAQLGVMLDLPQAVLNVTPFTHTPALPAGDFTALPTVALLGAALALGTLGAVAFRRRDLEF